MKLTSKLLLILGAVITALPIVIFKKYLNKIKVSCIPEIHIPDCNEHGCIGEHKKYMLCRNKNITGSDFIKIEEGTYCYDSILTYRREINGHKAIDSLKEISIPEKCLTDAMYVESMGTLYKINIAMLLPTSLLMILLLIYI
jgi:hypothetical protein